MRNWLKFLLISGLAALQGCAAGIAMGTMAAIGGGANSVFNDRRHPDVQQEDAKICEKIQERLNADSAVRNSAHVAPVCYNKIVLLVGEAPSEILRRRAIESARLTGVRRIHNEVHLRHPLSDAAQEQDTVLHTKVRALLTGQDFNGSSQTRMMVNDGTVYLMGLLTRNEAAFVEEVVRRVDGVRRVITLVEYVNLVPEA